MKVCTLFILSLSLVIVSLLLQDTTRANTAEISLKIIGTMGTCAYGSISDLGVVQFSETTQTVSGAFTGTIAPGGTTRRCYDSSGAASWHLSMVMSGDLRNEYTPSTIISSGSVYYSNYPIHQQLGSGYCASVTGASASITDWKVLNVSQRILEKIGSVNEVCRVQTTGLFLKVEIPGRSKPGLYSGEIVITAPSF